MNVINATRISPTIPVSPVKLDNYPVGNVAEILLQNKPSTFKICRYLTGSNNICSKILQFVFNEVTFLYVFTT